MNIKKEIVTMYKLLNAGCVLDNFENVKSIIKDFQDLEKEEYYKMLEKAKIMIRKEEKYYQEIAVKYNWI